MRKGAARVGLAELKELYRFLFLGCYSPAARMLVRFTKEPSSLPYSVSGLEI
jgi:hypothetical protein